MINKDFFSTNSNKNDNEIKTKSFNGLTAKEWALNSKSVWNDLSSPRNKYQLDHGAVFPLKLAERLIDIYSNKQDVIFDPFLGIGTTLIASQNKERHCIGIELNEKFTSVAENWKNDNSNLFNYSSNLNYKIVNDDCRNMKKYIASNKIQLTITSPPYANFINKSLEDRKTVHKKSYIKYKNNSTIEKYSDDLNDFGNLDYTQFLKELKNILRLNYKITKLGGYSAWVIKDHRDTKNKIPHIPFHSDLYTLAQKVGWKLQDVIIWDQNNQRRLIVLGYPSVFYINQNNSYIVILRKS